MLRSAVALGAAGLLLLGLLLGGRTLSQMAATPIEYDPRTRPAPATARPADPARLVEAAMLGASRRPPAGTRLVKRRSALEWERLTPSAEAIAAVEACHVRLSSPESVLHDLLDDDPSLAATVDLLVTTVGGRQTGLRVGLWGYGRLLPVLVQMPTEWQPGTVEWAPAAPSDEPACLHPLPHP